MRWIAWLLMLPLLGACQGGQPQGESPLAGTPSPRPVQTSTPAALASPGQTFHRDPKTGLAALPALGSAPIELRATWEQMTGLDRFLQEPEYGKTLRDLKPEPTRSYRSSAFLMFLPPAAVQLGAAYPIPSDAVPVGTSWTLPKNAVARFLQQFHPSTTAEILIDAPGAYAVLRARSQDRWEIVFRVHAQLQVAPNVFMSPSQFEGRLLVNLPEGRIDYAQILVPRAEDGRPNVAMDAARGDALAGVGTLPRMELVGGDERLLTTTSWLEQMPMETARKVLAQRFYPFQAVEWSPLKVALARASIEHKPLLAIVIAGPLDDQAC